MITCAGAWRALRNARRLAARPCDHGALGADDLGAGIRLGDVPGGDLRLSGSIGCPAPRPSPTASTRIELVLPVAVLVIYNFGYYTRMTRASMAEVMTSQYMRTAILKGLPYRRVVIASCLAQRADRAVHGDDPAAQLSAVRRDRGRGVLRLRRLRQALYDAAHIRRHLPVEACTMVAVFVAVLSQFISDVGYTLPQSAHPVQLRDAMTDADAITDCRKRAAAASSAFSRRSALLREIADRHDRRLPGAVLGEHGDARRRSCRCATRWRSRPDLLKPILSPAPDGGIYWLGTDDKGRDMLSRLIWGSRLVLVLGDARHRRRLCRRHADGRGRRLSRRLVGRDHLVHRQRVALVPADGALHRHHLAIRPESPFGQSSPMPVQHSLRRPQHRPRGDLRHGAAGGAHRARAGARPQDARLHRRGRGPRRVALAASCWSSSCPMRAGR